MAKVYHVIIWNTFFFRKKATEVNGLLSSSTTKNNTCSNFGFAAGIQERIDGRANDHSRVFAAEPCVRAREIENDQRLTIHQNKTWWWWRWSKRSTETIQTHLAQRTVSATFSYELDNETCGHETPHTEKAKQVDDNSNDYDDVIRCVTSKRNGQNQSCVVARSVYCIGRWRLELEYKIFRCFFVVRVNLISIWVLIWICLILTTHICHIQYTVILSFAVCSRLPSVCSNYTLTATNCGLAFVILMFAVFSSEREYPYVWLCTIRLWETTTSERI